MFSDFKNKSIKNRIFDKWQRRNKGNMFLLIKNYYYYFKNKIFYINKFKRNNLISQIKKNSIIAEIGVWKGSFSKIIFDNCKPTKLILVDAWIFNKNIRGCAPQSKGIDPLNQYYFDDAYKETKLKLKHFSNVMIFKSTSKEVSKKFKDNYFDYIYIDAEHSYSAVKQDLECWFPKLKKNGYIFGDDYHWREEDYSLSVERAYQDFFKINKIKFWCVFKSQIIFRK
tara:strand:+ start:1591 stop:2268 length:678 start_codon:yes stop_codon:yes gene_type:complete